LIALAPTFCAAIAFRPLSDTSRNRKHRRDLILRFPSGWLWMHESGTYLKFTPAGADLFAE
jgi:hypothetical protein